MERIVVIAALWLVARLLVRDHRAPLVPPLRLVRCDRSHLARGLW